MPKPITRDGRGKIKVKRPVRLKPPATIEMRSEAYTDNPALRGALGYPGAVDLRNVVLGAAITYRLNYRRAQELHQEFKNTVRAHAGWIETGGEHGNTPQMVYEECCESLRRLFGL